MKLKEENYEVPYIVSEYFNSTGKKLSKSNKLLYAVNLWHYTSNKTITKWHYDCNDNFLCQISGIKHVYLHPPNNINSIT